MTVKRIQFTQLLLVLALFGLALFSLPACNKGDDPVNDDTNEPVDTTVADLLFEVYYLSDTGMKVSDAFIGITPNDDNIEPGLFNHTGLTNSQGKYEFENLQPWRWYYKVEAVVFGTSYEKFGSIQLTGGVNQTRKVIIQ